MLKFEYIKVLLSSKFKGREAFKKKIADFETLSQLALPSPPLSPIETFLIETFLVLFDPSPRSLQLRHYFFWNIKNIAVFLRNHPFESVLSKKFKGPPLNLHSWDRICENSSWIFDKYFVKLQKKIKETFQILLIPPSPFILCLNWIFFSNWVSAGPLPPVIETMSQNMQIFFFEGFP